MAVARYERDPSGERLGRGTAVLRLCAARRATAVLRTAGRVVRVVGRRPGREPRAPVRDRQGAARVPGRVVGTSGACTCNETAAEKLFADLARDFR